MIMAAIPLELPGVFLALLFAHQTFSTVSLLGIVVLFGRTSRFYGEGEGHGVGGAKPCCTEVQAGCGVRVSTGYGMLAVPFGALEDVVSVMVLRGQLKI